MVPIAYDPPPSRGHSFLDSYRLATCSVEADLALSRLKYSKILRIYLDYDRYNYHGLRFHVIFILRLWCAKPRSFIVNLNHSCCLSLVSSIAFKPKTNISSLESPLAHSCCIRNGAHHFGKSQLIIQHYQTSYTVIVELVSIVTYSSTVDILDGPN